MLRETPDRVPRVVSVYMQEQPIPAVKNVESPWNKLPVQSIYRAIDTHQSLSTTKVAKNIEEYGSWLLAQKSKLDQYQKEQELLKQQKLNNKDREDFLARHCLRYLSNCFSQSSHDLKSMLGSSKFSQLVCPSMFLSEMLMKMSSDLVGPLYILLPEEIRKIQLPILATAIANFRVELAEVDKSPKALKNIPRIAVLAFSEERLFLNEEVFNYAEQQPQLKDLNNLFYANLYLRSSMVVEEEPTRKHRMVLDLSQLKLSPPFGLELVYLFRNLIALELRDFNPDIIIVEDTLSAVKQTISCGAFALLLRSIVELANCRILYLKALGGDWSDSAHDGLAEVGVQQARKMNCFKNVLFKQSAIVLQSLYEVLDVTTLERYYYDAELDPKFLASFSEHVGRIAMSKVNQEEAGRYQLQLRLQRASEALDDYKKSKLFLSHDSNPRFTFYNFRDSQYESVENVVIGDNDQFYVHYGPEETLFFLFRKDHYKVYAKSRDCWKVVGMWVPSQKELQEYSVVDACLIASDKYLYRMFGRYNRLHGSLSTEPAHQLSESIFRIRLDYDQQHPPSECFQLERFVPTYEQVPKRLIVQRRCSAAGFYVRHKEKNQLFAIGGHLQSESEDTICRTVVVIENDTSLYSFGKFSEAGLEELIKARVRLRPNLYCLPFSVTGEDSEVAVLATNAFNYESCQRQPLVLNRYHSDTVHMRSTYTMQYKLDQIGLPAAQLPEPQGQMDRRTLDSTLMYFVVKSTQTVNRYEKAGTTCVSCYDPSLRAHVIAALHKQWSAKFNSLEESVQVVMIDDGQLREKFKTTLAFRRNLAPPPASHKI